MDKTFAVHESTRKRRRWGCACGCLVFVVGMLFGTVGLSVYMFQRNRPAPMDRWMTPSTSAFVDVRLNTADPGMGELFGHTLTTLAEAAASTGQPAPSPEAAKARAARVAQFAKALAWLLQPDVFVYMQRNAQGDGEDVLAVAQLRYVASWVMARVMLNAMTGGVAERDGATEVFQLRGDDRQAVAHFALTRQALMLSNSGVLVREAGRVRRDPSADARGSEALQRYMDELSLLQPPDGEDVAALLANEFNRLGDFLDWLEDQVGAPGLKGRIVDSLGKTGIAPGDVQAVKVSTNVLTADRARIAVSFYCLQSDTARRLTEVLRAVVTQITLADTAEGEHNALSVKSDVKQQGSAAVLTLEMSGIRGWLRAMLGVRPSAASLEAATTTPPTDATTAPVDR